MSQSSSAKHNFPELEDKVKRLRAKQAEWTQVSLSEKLSILKQIQKNALALVDEWLDVAGDWKAGKDGIKEVAQLDEIQGGVYAFCRSLSVMIQVLTPAAASESSSDGIALAKPPAIREVNGQKRVKVYPGGVAEGVLFPGMTIELYLEPGKEATQGTEYMEAKKRGTGALALVLGAGNQASIPFMDSLHRMFVRNEVVFLKHNPVAAYLYDIVEKVMQPLIQRDYFHHTKGGIEEGAYLLEACDNAHMTGSDKTYDTIVFGSLKNKQDGKKPVFTKEFTSELGNVTPFVIVPGAYSDAELNYLVQHVVGCVVNNNSFNCAAAKLIVVQKDWPQRAAFLQGIKTEMAKVPRKNAWYPGASQRYDAFLKHYGNKVEIVGETEKTEKLLPWAIIPDVPAKKGEYALCNEAFCGVLAETALDTHSVPEFLTASAKFCNEAVWGNLCISIFIDPSSEKQYAAEFDQYLCDLKYGGIAVNLWAATLFAIGVAAWGGYPGNKQEDIQSGIGFAGNLYMLDHVQKSVARAPTMLPMGAKYPWFPSHKTAMKLLRSLIEFESGSTYWGFARALWNGMTA